MARRDGNLPTPSPCPVPRPVTRPAVAATPGAPADDLGAAAVVSCTTPGPGALPHRRGVAPLRSVAGFLAVGAGVAAAGRVGVAFPCPFRSLTGWLCPLCGSTHLAWALERGDLGAAFRANQLVLVALVVVACCCVRWAWQAVRRPSRPRDVRAHAGPGRPGSGWQAQRTIYLVCGVVAVLWTLARNLVPGLS